jgi:RHS repeat-associated protein
MSYDSIGRPSVGTSAFGGTTNYTYSTLGAAPPLWQQENGPNGITITTLDGLGRAIRVTREDGNGNIQSYQDTVYAPCACSPLGKIQKVSMPYAPGATEYWTTYTYDGLGRTLSVQKPDGVSTTTYSYVGNVTTVTDPAGLAKTFTKDVLGNLLTVVEPDPTNQPSGTVTTSYSYDWMNHVACVDMDRGGTLGAYTYTSNGVTCTSVYAQNTGTRQTRTFVYSDAGLLTSTTNPETLNAVVSYTYDSYNRLSTKTDAKTQTFVYSYDASNRAIEIQKYPAGQYPNGQEDVCARVNYTYGNNAASYNYGRLTSASTLQVQGTCYSAPSYTESYTYGAPGNVASKTVSASGATWNSSYGQTATINYGYDSYGRTTSVQYPFSQSGQYGLSYSPVTFTTTYDTMGRPSGLTDSNGNTWVNSASTVYDYAGRLQTLKFLGVTETRGYDTVGQIASIGWSNSNYGQLSGTLTYTYPSGQTGVYSDGGKTSFNNGQISQMTDSISGETTVYEYDALKRVISASNSAGTETFSYDGFGNLTGKTLNGTLQSVPVNSATNQLSGPTYDLNGNMTVGAGATMSYNEDNRMSTAQESSGGVEYYYYTPDGKRFYRQMANGDTQYTLYGAHGEALGTFSVQGSSSHTEMSVYFGGRRLWQGPYYSSANGSQGAVFADRLGSNRNTGNYYPYGDAVGTAPQDQVGFATYTQDSYTGLDYADHRMYASTYGRFNSPDPYRRSAKPRNPGSWNRYAYALGDPINGSDPTGLYLPDLDGFDDGGGGDFEGGGFADPGYLGNFFSGGADPNATGAGLYVTTTVSYDGGGSETDSGYQTLPPGESGDPSSSGPSGISPQAALQGIPDDPDYSQFCVTAGLGLQFGVCAAKNLQDGSVYFGPTVSFGLGWPPTVTLGAVTGRLNQTLPPSATAVNSWLSGLSGSITAGIGVIGSVQISNGQNGLENSVESGVGNPQAGVSVGYNFCVTLSKCQK